MTRAKSVTQPQIKSTSSTSRKKSGRTNKKDFYSNLNLDQLIKASTFDYFKSAKEHNGDAYWDSTGADYKALLLEHITDGKYQAYPIYRPGDLYSNTNSAYIQRLDRANSWGMFKAAFDDRRGPYGDPPLGRRDDGNAIRRRVFEQMYADNAFDGVRGNFWNQKSEFYQLGRKYFNDYFGGTSPEISSGPAPKLIGKKDKDGNRIMVAEVVKDGETVQGYYQKGEFIAGKMKMNGKLVDIPPSGIAFA